MKESQEKTRTTPELEEVLRAAKKAVEQNTDDLWGFRPLSAREGSILLIGKKLLEEKRREIISQFPDFAPVYFLSGWEKEGWLADPSLVQRVMMYGGSLPGWEWTLGTDEWREFLGEREYLRACDAQLKIYRQVYRPKSRFWGLFSFFQKCKRFV